MSLLDALRHRFRSAIRPAAADREREEEYAFHQSLAARQRVHEGASPDEARFAAKREFGNATLLKEESRWMGAGHWLDSTRQDLRFGWRALRRSPLFTLVAVTSLGLGIGANAVIFGIIHSLLLARVPVRAASELRLVSHEPDGPLRAFFSGAEAEALQANPNVNVAALRQGFVPRVEVNGATINGVSLDVVDGSFFRIVAPGLAAGRAITEEDARSGTPVGVVSYDFANTHFGSARATVGKTIKLGETLLTIIGVSDAGYAGLAAGQGYAMTVPSTAMRLLGGPANDQAPTFLITRLRGDSARVHSALDATFAACCANGELSDPRMRRGEQRIGFIDVSRGIEEGKKINVRAQYEGILLALMGGVAVLLLIACTNVGNLLMARATARARELAVRLSLGASRGRIVRQLLVEATLLAAIGGTAGIMFAIWGSAALSRNLPAGIRVLERVVAIRPGLVIFAFTAAVSIACAIIFGVLPALRATSGDMITSLRETQGGVRRTRALDRGIVATQVGLALLLVSSAGLLITTLRHLASSIGGSNPETLIAIQLDARGTPHSDTALQALVPELTRRFRALPGVSSVAESYVVPLIYGGLPTGLLDLPGLETSPESDVEVANFDVGPGYFGTLGVRLIAGRDFDSTDVRGSKLVAVISENLAQHFFSTRNPVGQQLRYRGSNESLEIIGVVADAKQVDLRAPAPWTVYQARAQWPQRWGDRAVFAVRTSVQPAQVVPAARAVIDELLPNIRIRHLNPMSDLLSLTIGKERALAMLSVAFGVLAVILAAVGLYGVMAFQVSSRTREIGVRMALGAGRGQVMRMVMGQALALVGVGVLLGVPLAFGGARAMRALLYGVTPFDPFPVALSVAVLFVVGLVAAALPSRNAARVDPLVAIRSD